MKKTNFKHLQYNLLYALSGAAVVTAVNFLWAYFRLGQNFLDQSSLGLLLSLAEGLVIGLVWGIFIQKDKLFNFVIAMAFGFIFANLSIEAVDFGRQELFPILTLSLVAGYFTGLHLGAFLEKGKLFIMGLMSGIALVVAQLLWMSLHLLPDGTATGLVRFANDLSSTDGVFLFKFSFLIFFYTTIVGFIFFTYARADGILSKKAK